MMGSMTKRNVMSVRDTYEMWRAREAFNSLDYDTVAEHYAYNLPENAVRFDSLAELRERVTACGSHYFDADAIRFFRARTHTASVGRDLWSGRFWVESRKHENPYAGVNEPREYQIAWVSDYNGFLSVEKLGLFDNLPAARRAARDLAEAVEGGECDRHGGMWGADETCPRCTREDGTPRPVGELGPLLDPCIVCGAEPAADGLSTCEDCR